jgi:hypothetical protein
MPRRERRRHRRSLAALSEAHDTGMLFPRVRPRDEVVVAFAGRLALELPVAAVEIPQDRIEEGVALVAESERRRIVDELRARYPSRWASLTAAAGDVGLTERAIVASAVKCAVIERLPIRRGLFELIEAMPAPASPCGVLVLALDGSLIWDRDDAIVIGRTIPPGRDAMSFYAEAHALADRRVEEWQLGRVRELAERIRDELPVVGLDRASRLLDEGIAEVAADDAAAAWVAGALLARYADLVYRGAIESS